MIEPPGGYFLQNSIHFGKKVAFPACLNSWLLLFLVRQIGEDENAFAVK
jgi:hypothetical protein